MIEYKTFEDEQPEAGRLVELNRSDEPCAKYTKYIWADGFPRWVGVGFVYPNDNWRYSKVKEPTSPLCNSEQQAECNTQCESPADPPKIQFSVEDGLLVGKKTETGWSISIPTWEAYDALLDYSRLVAISSQSPVSNTNEGSKLRSWSQELEKRDTRIENLRGVSSRQQAIIGEQVEVICRMESTIKKHEETVAALRLLIGEKDKSINALLLEKQAITARLNQPD